MKSFISAFQYFIIPIIVVMGVSIYLGFKQPAELPTTATISTSPSVSSTSLISPAPIPKNTLTPPLQRPYPLANTSKALPVPSPKQMVTGADDIYSLSSPPPKNYTVLSPPNQTEIPFHIKYEENANDLVEIGIFYERKAYLNREAAEMFKQMQLAAQQEGIEIIPVSGFRSVADQKKLFERQIQRQGSKKAASKLSAPPGFSEHHTGYALDVGDGKSPNTVLKLTFDSTEAYRWLEVHAAQYGFELSFPKNNFQGVSYEPWHWRFVGSATAQEIFRVAKTQRQ
jgi:D-alanyl-D-alanine carboxypeptidase